MDNGSMKIYTKSGDKGQTSLIGGVRVPKDHPRIEAYGTLDELNGFLGLARDHVEDARLIAEIVRIQEDIFVIESMLAAASEETAASLPQIKEDSILLLEQSIDLMESQMPALRNFILPGGNPAGSYLHVSRSVCRRAERLVISLAHDEPVDIQIIKYINRLSDYLFVAARFVSISGGHPVIEWTPKR